MTGWIVVGGVLAVLAVAVILLRGQGHRRNGSSDSGSDGGSWSASADDGASRDSGGGDGGGCD